jgi:YidC/Oxa1 family membrane protein insertase
MEKRVLLAVFLSFLVLLTYQVLFVKPVPKRLAPAPAASSSSSGSGAEQTTATSSVPPPASATAPVQAEAPLRPTTPALVSDTAERDVSVDTATVHAVFTTRGATLKSWRLKRFLDAGRQPLELVPQDVPPTEWPFRLEVDDPAVTTRLNEALFKPSMPTLTVAGSPATLTFEFEDAAGLRATKSFQFQPESYVVSLTTTVSVEGQVLNPRVSMGAGLGDPEEAAVRGAKKPEGLICLDTKVQRFNASTLAKQSTYEGDLRFGGVDDHYFLSAVVLSGPVKLEYGPVVGHAKEANPVAPGHEYVSYRVRFPSPPSGARFFIGPKEFDALAAVDRDLVRSIDFGMFAVIVVPLLRSLKWVNGYVGNYGWSIILLTVFINALMFPLRHKSVVSMRKMQELQPQVKAIQDRYAKFKTTDPERQKMNSELMNLYRERGVNPASGCVPMLLTMPVLLAFYSLLGGAIEIRGEPFFGWIHDLSMPDPFYITPIIMAGTMFVQQKMTPSTADPAQQRMMLMMPLVFGFMFLKASSGLVLYWLVSNVWAIGQQYVTNRIIGPPIVKAVRPPAERRLKSAGGGRTAHVKDGE